MLLAWLRDPEDVADIMMVCVKVAELHGYSVLNLFPIIHA
jgi:hypothetical protein